MCWDGQFTAEVCCDKKFGPRGLWIESFVQKEEVKRLVGTRCTPMSAAAVCRKARGSSSAWCQAECESEFFNEEKCCDLVKGDQGDEERGTGAPETKL